MAHKPSVRVQSRNTLQDARAIVLIWLQSLRNRLSDAADAKTRIDVATKLVEVALVEIDTLNLDPGDLEDREMHSLSDFFVFSITLQRHCCTIPNSQRQLCLVSTSGNELPGVSLL